MRIVHVEMTPSGGLYQFGVQLSEALARRGHAVDLLTGTEPEVEPRHDGVTLVPALRTWHPTAGPQVSRFHRRLRRVARGARYLVAWRDVVRYVRHTRPDAVIVGNLVFALDGAFVWWLGRPRILRAGRLRRRPWTLLQIAHTPAPLSWSSQPGATLYKHGPLLDVAIGRAYRRIDVPVVLGARSRDELCTRWPSAREPLVIPHGATGLAFPHARSAALVEPIALFFGTWSRYKGLDVLIEAWAEVARRVPEAKLLVVGAPTKDIDVEAIRERAAILPSVELRPGYVPIEQIPELMDSARLIVLPYRAANQSGVVGLAQQASRPVVATDVGDLSDHVRPDDTGFLVPPEDPRALAAALVTVLTDAELAGRLGDAARAAGELADGWDEAAERIEARVKRDGPRYDSPSDGAAPAAPRRPAGH